MQLLEEKMIKVGEDNTKKFHAMATQRNRRNAISMIKANDGRLVNDHAEMAGFFGPATGKEWGILRELICSLIYLVWSLGTRVQGLEEISQPFLQE
jgi:hypothetical protein